MYVTHGAWFLIRLDEGRELKAIAEFAQCLDVVNQLTFLLARPAICVLRAQTMKPRQDLPGFGRKPIPAFFEAVRYIS